MDQIIAIVKQWLPIITSVVGVFAMIATMTKNKADNMFVDILYRIINVLGGNIGNAKNK